MASAYASNWRLELKALERYGNIEKLKEKIEAQGLSSTGNSNKTAFAIETEAYNTSESRETYEATCDAIIENGPADPKPIGAITNVGVSEGPGISIGQYIGCHHVASGFISEVYRSASVALKVITETKDVEPHNPAREVKILNQISHESIIHLNSTFKDNSGRLVLVFPFMPLTLAKIIASGSVPENLTRTCFHGLFSALDWLHSKEIIHRDIKPSNILLESPTGPAYLSDFGTSWHPTLSTTDEPPHHKVLEVGTTCYRAPETLFGNRSYSTSLDIWETGTMLAECLRTPPKSLFESRDTSEDGNQLGLILSIFKTIGTPTRKTWPEAVGFSTPPFEWYQIFPGNEWDVLLSGVDEKGRDLVRNLVRYESGERLTAAKALKHPFFTSSS